MLKSVCFSLITILYSTQALSENDLNYKSNPLNISHKTNLSNLKKNEIEDNSSQVGKFEPNGSATIDSIKLDLTPQWASVSDNVDRERAGFKNIQVACLSKSCKKKHSDIDDEFAKLGEKFKK